MNFEVYCDESRTEYFYAQMPGEESYVLIGGLWIEATEREDYKAKIKALRETHDVYGEFKWNRVSPSRQQFYLALVRLFFEEAMRFRYAVIIQIDSRNAHRARFITAYVVDSPSALTKMRSNPRW